MLSIAHEHTLVNSIKSITLLFDHSDSSYIARVGLLYEFSTVSRKYMASLAMLQLNIIGKNTDNRPTPADQRLISVIILMDNR